MHVFVKAFSRPFYLDRSLVSLKSFFHGYGGITVLDDGLPGPALERLKAIHPDVNFARAPWADDKGAIIRDSIHNPEKYNLHNDLTEVESYGVREATNRILYQPKDMDPLPFWRAEIAKHDDTAILLMEEDCWAVKEVDLGMVEAAMADSGGIATHIFMNGANKKFTSSQPVAEIGEDVFLEKVTPPWPIDRTCSDTYFPVSLTILNRRFWLDATEGPSSWIPEEPFHRKGLEILAARGRDGAAFFRITPEPIRHGFSLSCRVPAFQYGRSLNLYDISDMLTSAWLDGRLPAMDGFPDDFRRETLERLLAGELAQGEFSSFILLSELFSHVYEAKYDGKAI